LRSVSAKGEEKGMTKRIVFMKFERAKGKSEGNKYCNGLNVHLFL